MSVYDTHYDLLVAGGGFAGFASAVAAAERGLSVLLVEKSNALGGAPGTCLVNPFMPYFTWREDNSLALLSGGLFARVCNELINMTKALDGDDSPYARRPIQIFNEEYLKVILNRMALRAGVTLLFHTAVIAAGRDGNRITSVTLSNSDGLHEMSAGAYVDATGDAELSVLAGFPTHLGREGDNLCQPMTLCFRVGEVDTAVFRENRALMQSLYKQFKAEGKIKNPREDVLIFGTTAEHVLHFNTTRVVKLNPVDAADVTRAEIEAREQVFELCSFLKDNVPGFEKARLLSTALHIGVRESRMIDGEYTLTQDDLTSMTKFPDGIACCNYDIDIHNPEGSGTSHWYFPRGEYYTIPYRCLIPRGADNLLVAGRCISSTHEAQASYRIMPTVCTLGEAAGAAAALAKTSGVSVRNVDTDALRSELEAAGAILKI